MAELDHFTVADCEALHRVGTVTAVNSVARTLDVEIGEVVHEEVAVHYHCDSEWASHSHPHSNSECDRMLAAFTVGDEVLVLCDEDERPLYVMGFLEAPKRCDPIIVLVKQVGESYDWWYYDPVSQQGYHEDPVAPDPMTPEIVTKWWACEGLEEVEYYTRATPGLSVIDTQACQDSCGLINFDDEECCEAPASAPDDPLTWDNCPCGGTWDSSDERCEGSVECGGFSETRYLPGCSSTQSRTANNMRTCPLGSSWNLSFGSLVEGIEVGPRIQYTGFEAKSICTASEAVCGPYVRNKRCCDGWDEEAQVCTGGWDPYGCGQECHDEQVCTGWAAGPPGAVWRWSVMSETGGPIPSGCVVLETEAKQANYSTESASLVTKIVLGERETRFEGGWNQYISAVAELAYIKKRVGYTNACQSCEEGTITEAGYDHASYSFSELSYGVGGWRTVVASDGRIAILIPELSLSCAATYNDGVESGEIASTTTALLRVVDDEGEIDFELIGAEQNYAIGALPYVRDDLGIKPNCYPRELPLDIDIRGFHWHELHDQILVGFVLKGEFDATLIKKEGGLWVKDPLTAFKDWVEANSLEDHTIYLH